MSADFPVGKDFLSETIQKMLSETDAGLRSGYTFPPENRCRVHVPKPTAPLSFRIDDESSAWKSAPDQNTPRR
jgi:hypothetical protein